MLSTLNSHSLISTRAIAFWGVVMLLLVHTRLLAQLENNYKPIQYQGTIPHSFIEDVHLKTSDEIETTDDNLTNQQKQEYYVVRNFQLRSMLLSGYVYFNDTLTGYINGIADRLLKDDPELRKQVKFYVTRSDAPNAFTLSDGSIFINIGLLELLENDSQLAYILCHEMVHYTRQHSLLQYKRSKNKNARVISDGNADTRFLRELRYSRANELEADSLGFEMYVKAGYEPYQALMSLNLLRVADDIYFKDSLNLNQIFSTDSFSVDSMISHTYLSSKKKIKGQSSRRQESGIDSVDTSMATGDSTNTADDLVEDNPADTATNSEIINIDLVTLEKVESDLPEDTMKRDEQTEREEVSHTYHDTLVIQARVIVGTDTILVYSNDDDREDDTYSTHPSVNKRILQIYGMLQKDSSYLVEKPETAPGSYAYINDLAHFELVQQYTAGGYYLFSLYQATQLAQKFPDNLYLTEMICRDLFWLDYYQKLNAVNHINSRFYSPEDEEDENYSTHQGIISFYHFAKFFTDMLDNDFSDLAEGYLEQSYRQHPQSDELLVLYARFLNLQADRDHDKAMELYHEFVDRFKDSPHYAFVLNQLKE